jgi:hypothetical protein
MALGEPWAVTGKAVITANTSTRLLATGSEAFIIHDSVQYMMY